MTKWQESIERNLANTIAINAETAKLDKALRVKLDALADQQAETARLDQTLRVKLDALADELKLFVTESREGRKNLEALVKAMIAESTESRKNLDAFVRGIISGLGDGKTGS